MSLTKVDFPLPETPVTQVKHPTGIAAVIFFRLFSRAPNTLNQPSPISPASLRSLRGGTRCRGTEIFRVFFRYCAVSESSLSQDLCKRSLRDDPSTTRTCAGTEIENVIRRADRILVVLDDDDRISKVAQSAQRIDEALIVALMKTDARLVEHVENTRKTRTDLRRQPDPLRLASA